MTQFQFFPRSIGITDQIKAIIECFETVQDQIDSDSNTLSSNQVLEQLKPHFERAGFLVESGKKDNEKIKVPVLFGLGNKVDKFFNADALSFDGKIVVEVEAGRAVENYQFLKDIFQASMMHGVDYLVLAVRNKYRHHEDFKQVYTFLETMYISSRLILPLKGILLIGY
jgi:hypothetical protein